MNMFHLIWRLTMSKFTTRSHTRAHDLLLLFYHLVHTIHCGHIPANADARHIHWVLSYTLCAGVELHSFMWICGSDASFVRTASLILNCASFTRSYTVRCDGTRAPAQYRIAKFARSFRTKRKTNLSCVFRGFVACACRGKEGAVIGFSTHYAHNSLTVCCLTPTQDKCTTECSILLITSSQ